MKDMENTNKELSNRNKEYELPPLTKEQLDYISKIAVKTMRDLIDAKDYDTIIDLFSKYHSRSLTNQMYLYFQNRDLTIVKDLQEWNYGGRSIIPKCTAFKVVSPIFETQEVEKVSADGEPELDDDGCVKTEIRKSLVGYRPKNVFDVSQTKSKTGEIYVDPIKGKAGEELMNILGMVAGNMGYTVEQTEHKKLHKGTHCAFDLTNRKISIDEELPIDKFNDVLIDAFVKSMQYHMPRKYRMDLTNDEQKFENQTVRNVIDHRLGRAYTPALMPDLANDESIERFMKQLDRIRFLSGRFIGNMSYAIKQQEFKARQEAKAAEKALSAVTDFEALDIESANVKKKSKVKAREMA